MRRRSRSEVKAVPTIEDFLRTFGVQGAYGWIGSVPGMELFEHLLLSLESEERLLYCVCVDILIDSTSEL
jgi:hypothetical protein